MTLVKLDKHEYHLQSLVIKPIIKNNIHTCTRITLALNDSGYLIIQTNPDYEPKATMQLYDVLSKPLRALEKDATMINIADIISFLKQNDHIYQLKEESLVPYRGKVKHGTYVKVPIPNTHNLVNSYHFLEDAKFRVTADFLPSFNDYTLILKAHGTEGKTIKGVALLQELLSHEDMKSLINDFSETLVDLSKEGHLDLVRIQPEFNQYYHASNVKLFKVHFNH